MSAWRRIVCAVFGHKAATVINFVPGDGVTVTVTSNTVRCSRCSRLVRIT